MKFYQRGLYFPWTQVLRPLSENFIPFFRDLWCKALTGFSRNPTRGGRSDKHKGRVLTPSSVDNSLYLSTSYPQGNYYYRIHSIYILI